MAICADIWSKKRLTASFPGVKAYLTLHGHKRNQATLVVRRPASPHTAKNVEAVVVEVLGEWEIPKEEISAVLTNNGSYMVKALMEWLVDLHAASGNGNTNQAALYLRLNMRRLCKTWKAPHVWMTH